MGDTGETVLVSVLIALLVVAAAVISTLASDRGRRRHAATPAPTVPPEVATVLSVLRSSAVVINDDDQVVKASAQAYSLGLVRGTSLLSDELAVIVREVRSDGQIQETELEIERPGQPVRHVSARVAPLGTHLVLVLVEDRTRERRVDAVRRDFVANVSHELKTPVGAIRLLADAVSEASDDPAAVKRFAARMLTESERLTQLVQQIIELSRLQEDEPPEQPLPVDVDTIISNAIDTSMMDAGQKHIQMRRVGQTGLEVYGSEDQIGAAITNLVANAVAYSDPKSTVTVSVSSLAGSVDITVTDEGIGIPAQEIDRIFERFYRVDPARHRATGGTGLGLSIVKHVAATHGGEVKVRSVEGEGSTFTLSLPQYIPTDEDGLPVIDFVTAPHAHMHKESA